MLACSICGKSGDVYISTTSELLLCGPCLNEEATYWEAEAEREELWKIDELVKAGVWHTGEDNG